MSLDPEILEFLKEQLPRADERQLAHVFDGVFSENATDVFVGASEGAEEDNKVRLAISAVEKAQRRIDELPQPVQKRLNTEQPNGLACIEAVRSFLALKYELARVYHKSRRETGGRNQLGHDIADAVHLALTDLGETPKFGTDAYAPGRPSTAYGRIVERALKHHKIDCDWRRPAEGAWRTYRR